MAAMLWSAQAWAQTVFINEIHYDNAGTDEGEGVEILGPAGTNLTGWSIVAYNGSGGASYLTIDLTGIIIPNELGGYGAVQVLTLGLQNGSPDGIALINNGTVVQFLTYEGSFTASNGPATGIVGTDIGVSQSSAAALGSSMQLQGSGTQYSDFTWVSADLSNSFGSINANQTAGEIIVEDIIVINEVDADQIGTDAAEFVELYDGGAGNTSLDGLVLVLFNGSDDLSYATIGLEGYSTNADGYFVIGSALVQNVDLVSFTVNGIQNGADAVALYTGDAANFPPGTALTTDGLIDALVYSTSDPADLELLALLNAGQTQVDENLNSNAAGESMQRLPNGSGGSRNTSTYGMLPPTPGDENGEAPQVTLIHAIQGSGIASPLIGSFVVIEGIVVADFQTTASGFYVQEEDSDADADALTSEGIFVFAPGAIDVAEGDFVRVEGVVVEFFELTELTSVSSVEILGTNQPLPVVLDISLPLPEANYLERFEGMLIRFPQTLSVTNNFLLGRGSELGLSFGDRLYQPTHIHEPGIEAEALKTANALNYIIIDDASTAQNPDPTLFPINGLSFENTVRGGDEVSNIQGVLTYAWSGFNLSGVSTNAYRVYTTEVPVFTQANARMDAPTETGGSFKVASFNVLNYFNGDGTGGGFPTSRGAGSLIEFDRQRSKIINAILALDAAVVGLIEIENDGYGANSAIQDLINGLNEVAGEGTYALVDPGLPQIGTDQISCGFVYQPALAQPNGAAVILDSSIDPAFDDTRNRPALLQNFEDLASGNSINVVVNHLKSKGSNCNDIGDVDTGDGQGNCNLTRTSAAIALANWLETDPSQQNSPYNLIIGDLNSYAKEDPIIALQDLGYADILHALNGSEEYSFQFGGRWGYLDYAMANQALNDLVTGATAWKINADEPAVLDYNVDFKTAGQVISFFSESAFRSSDHDPIVVGFNFAPTDCLNISGGLAVIDECGVCRLPDDPDFNSTCADCAGVPNGTATTDLCGACDNDPGNDNTTCLDCAAVPNGTATNDLCGVCDSDPSNDNTTCLDCAGVPNGTATTDLCGACDNDPSNDDITCADCLGIPNGEAITGSACFVNGLAGIYDNDCVCVTNLVEEPCRYFLSNYNSQTGSKIYEFTIDEANLTANLTLIHTTPQRVSIALNPVNGLLYLIRETGNGWQTINTVTNPVSIGPKSSRPISIGTVTGAAFDENGLLFIATQQPKAIWTATFSPLSIATYSQAQVTGGDLVFNEQGDLNLISRSPQRVYKINQNAPNTIIGQAPANVIGVALNVGNTYLVSVEGSDELILADSNASDLEIRYQLLLNGQPFVASNGDLASGCSAPQAAAINGDEELVNSESLSNLYSLPNPTNGISTVVYQPTIAERARLDVFDLQGRSIATIFNQLVDAQQVYTYQFDGSALPNGVYLYRLTTDSDVKVEKFMIAK